jgi:transcriptional regulator with GAF, ATPase, and Fis domain
MSIELERVLRDRHRPIGDASASEKRAGFSSAAMREAMASVRQVVGYRVTVLLQGETGTGKELLARQVHALSPRAKQPFVVQDCGALVETLLDSELFGHVKGAFTGAVSDHPGLFVLADGGTIFLDEIENTTSNLQAKLLRVLETGEVRPVGGASVRRVDVRVVAASNRPLQEEVNQGRFRADLFYRLNSFLIEVPPLRGRTEDILPLAREFIDQANRSLGKSARGLTRQAERILLDWSWPGNVRELRNVIERAVLLSGPMELLDVSRLPRSMQGKQEVPNAMNVGVLSPSQPLRHVLEATERDALAAALKHHQGVLRRAAQALSMDPQTFRRRARALGLIPNQPRSGRTASSN